LCCFTDLKVPCVYPHIDLSCQIASNGEETIISEANFFLQAIDPWFCARVEVVYYMEKYCDHWNFSLPSPHEQYLAFIANHLLERDEIWTSRAIFLMVIEEFL